MRARSVAVARLAGWIVGGAPFAIAAFFVLSIIVALLLIEVSGIPEEQALVRTAQRAGINHWGAAFCEKYGMPQGTERHTACLNDLLNLRR